MKNQKITKSKTKEYVKEYNKVKYIENREKILVAVSKKVYCNSCKQELVSCKMGRHIKSSKHLNNMEKENEKNADNNLT